MKDAKEKKKTHPNLMGSEPVLKIQGTSDLDEMIHGRYLG